MARDRARRPRGLYVRFDDSLDTVLSADMSTPAGVQTVWRQLVDLIGRGRAPANGEMLGRLAAIRDVVPAPVRTASARAIAHGAPPPALVRFFAEDDAAVAAPLLRTAALADADWLPILPVLSPTGRSVLRHRRDLGPAAVRALESFGSVDFVLPAGAHVAHAPPPTMEDAAAETPTVAPAESPFVSLGTAAKGLPIVAEAIRQQDAAHAPAPDIPADDDADSDGAGSFEIADLVARIDAYQRRRGQAPAVAPDAEAPSAPLTDFRFETDEGGVVRWVSGTERAPIIGLSLVHGAAAGSRVDGVAAGAFRRRASFTDARLVIEGRSRAAGGWRISGAPIFEPLTGRFAGYRGTARRPRADESAAPRGGRGGVPDSLRQIVHELRTPTGAIAGFAEMIEREMAGPVADAYRERAGTIRRQARDLLAAIEDLDTAARIESRALELRPVPVALRPLFVETAADLAPLAELRGAAPAIDPDMPDLEVLGDAPALERLVGRLMAALTAAGGRGETIGVTGRVEDDQVVVAIDRPAGLAAYSGEALLAIDAEQEAAIEGAPLLGTGFALRLARNLAAELGGNLAIGADGLTLRLPAARNDGVGQVSGH